MTQLIKTLAILGLLLGLGSSVSAQSGCGGQFGALKFCGTISGGLPGAVLIPPGGTTPIGGNTVLGNPTTSNALPIATIAPILGIPGTSVGSVGFGNATSGTITLQPVTGALGSSVLSLPAVTDTVAGKALANGGTNASLTASNGGILWSNATQAQILAGTATSRQMLQSGATATPAWSTATWPATTAAGTLLASGSANTVTATATPVLGVPTSLQGTLGFAGVTSGTATVTAQGAAGTPTITLPNASGTLADGASSPLALSATTGNLTCATCVTSSGGGAITGTAPVAVSAAGAVSITGSAGGVLAGASPAFTATPTLGASGTVGTLALGNATSGTVTLGTVTGALGSATVSLPAATDTLVGKATTDTLTNKTLSASSDVLGGVSMSLGSDGTGDLYYRNAGGILTRLAIGSSTNVLTVSGGLPAWSGAGSGTITVCGTASSGTCAMPYFSAHPSAGSTTVTSGVSTKVANNTKDSDSNTWYDATTNFRFTPLLAGRYLVHAVVICTASTTIGSCASVIEKNSAVYAESQTQQTSTNITVETQQISAIITMNGTTDFVEAFMSNTCTGTCAYVGGTGPLQTFFEASFISP